MANAAASTTDTTVAIPWRPQPDRLDAYRRVTAFWQHHGFPTVTADSNPTLPFSLAEARNNAVHKVKTSQVIVADADAIPDIAAIHTALDNTGVTWPFNEYRHIPGTYANNPDLMTAPIDRLYRNSVGGCIVTHTATYWTLGGMDERFDRRWGYEDNAFHAVVTTLSTAHRVPGILFSFNHTAEREMTHDNPNRWRADLYKYAAGTPQLIRELIKR
jgi:hypothetical protein